MLYGNSKSDHSRFKSIRDCIYARRKMKSYSPTSSVLLSSPSMLWLLLLSGLSCQRL